MSNEQGVIPGSESSQGCLTDLQPVLSQLVRGLSSLFWGLPLTLIVSVQAITISPLSSIGLIGVLIPSATFTLLLYGLILLGRFRPQDLAWRSTLDRARLVALTNLGLSPFLYWYQRMPETALFSTAVALLALFSVAFLFALNAVLRRLAACLPDSLLRLETNAFTRLNSICLLLLPILTLAWLAAWRWTDAPFHVKLVLQSIEPFRVHALLFLTLLPLSVTMSLLWKAKETVFHLAGSGDTHS